MAAGVVAVRIPGPAAPAAMEAYQVAEVAEEAEAHLQVELGALAGEVK